MRRLVCLVWGEVDLGEEDWRAQDQKESMALVLVSMLDLDLVLAESGEYEEEDVLVVFALDLAFVAFLLGVVIFVPFRVMNVILAISSAISSSKSYSFSNE